MADQGVVTVACPACRRPNASHRAACLYCGAAMPNPTAPPTVKERELPADLDALVRSALAKGDASKVKAALLHGAPGGGGPVTSPGFGPGTNPGFGRSTSPGFGPSTNPGFGPSTRPGFGPPGGGPASIGAPRLRGDPLRGEIGDPDTSPGRWSRPGLTDPERRGPPPPAPDRVPPPSAAAAALSQLSRWSGRAEADLSRGDPAGVRACLDALRAALDVADGIFPAVEVELSAASVEALPPSPPLANQPAAQPTAEPAAEATAEAGLGWSLPRHRQPYLLVAEGPADVSRAPKVAEALGVDGVTARLVAVSRHPRVALRHEDAAKLAVLAQRLREHVGLAAVVVARAQLQSVEAPAAVLAGSPGRRLLVSRALAWLLPPEPGLNPSLRGDALSLLADAVRVVVPGEVVLRSYRAGRGLAHGRRDEVVMRAAGERRLQLVDLHGPGLFLRVVEGLTDMAGLPGYDPNSALRSARGFVEAVGDLWPAARVEGPRSCLPGDAPTAEERLGKGDHVEATGWSEWEEHTRCCRFLAGLRPDELAHLTP